MKYPVAVGLLAAMLVLTVVSLLAGLSSADDGNVGPLVLIKSYSENR
jgi:hypothetical protein